MRLYTFVARNRERIGVEVDGDLIDVNLAHAARMRQPGAGIASTLVELIRRGDNALRLVRAVVKFAREEKEPGKSREWRFALAKARLRAPIPRPGKIFCSGLNYRSHVTENPEAKFLEDPRFFVKVPTAVIGPGEPIRWPGEKFQVDYEVELAVVIGKPAYRLSQSTALNHVFGYTILHDVSARWIQFKDRNEDMGKNFDTFAPLGPCIVTRDDIPDPAQLKLSLKVNGRTLQNGTNQDWCFSLPRMLEWLTMGITLEPGDILSTGTPAGAGFFRRPQVFLKPGDVCELEIDGIGKLVNPVERNEYPPFSS